MFNDFSRYPSRCNCSFATVTEFVATTLLQALGHTADELLQIAILLARLDLAKILQNIAGPSLELALNSHWTRP